MCGLTASSPPPSLSSKVSEQEEQNTTYQDHIINKLPNNSICICTCRTHRISDLVVSKGGAGNAA